MRKSLKRTANISSNKRRLTLLNIVAITTEAAFKEGKKERKPSLASLIKRRSLLNRPMKFTYFQPPLRVTPAAFGSRTCTSIGMSLPNMSGPSFISATEKAYPSMFPANRSSTSYTERLNFERNYPSGWKRGSANSNTYFACSKKNRVS